jgi:hypothetical protein
MNQAGFTNPRFFTRRKILQSDASLAQQAERSAVNRKVTGSIPVGSAFLSLRRIDIFWDRNSLRGFDHVCILLIPHVLRSKVYCRRERYLFCVKFFEVLISLSVNTNLTNYI